LQFPLSGRGAAGPEGPATLRRGGRRDRRAPVAATGSSSRWSGRQPKKNQGVPSGRARLGAVIRSRPRRTGSVGLAVQRRATDARPASALLLELVGERGQAVAGIRGRQRETLDGVDDAF